MKRELYIKEIVQELSVLKNKVELLSSANLNDINIINEFHIKEVLNIVFDWSLSNVENSNNVAIDLQDEINSIAVQVTSNNRKNKIQDTVNKFLQYNLNKKYSTLIVFIVGKRLNQYHNLKTNGFNFSPKEHIIDLGAIISKLSVLTTLKIERIHYLFKDDKLPKTKTKNNINYFKKRQLIKNKIEKNLIRKDIFEIDKETIFYSPYYKFKYDKLIVRSIEDRAYPNFDENENHPISSWFKIEIHDLYEYGIEVMCLISVEIIVDNKMKWNYFEENTHRGFRKNVKKIRAKFLQRIPYDFIVDLDMTPDAVYGYPTLFVEYQNQRHYSEEIPFLIGYYNNVNDYRKVHYFEMKDRDVNL